MIFERLAVGSYAANCFILGDEESKLGFVVDPGGEAERIYKKIEEHNLTIKYIILTHGHGDHIGGVEQLKKLTGAMVLIHHDDEDMLEEPTKNFTSSMNGPKVSFKPDKTIGDREVLNIGNMKIRIIHTPGHTRGGICLYLEAQQILISGDTLFYGSVGRSDLDGGNHKLLIQSIQDKLMTLKDEVTVYPGHGASTSIGFERRKNPFIQG